MSFWETNSAILRRRYPGLLEELNREDEDALAPEDIRVEAAASGAPSLRLKGLHVHSPRDPVREGRRLAAELKDRAGGMGGGAGEDRPGAVIVLGFGLGYVAEAAAELAHGPLVIVEKHRELLHRALELRDLRNLLEKENVVFVPGGSGEGVSKALSLFEEAGTERAVPVVIRNPALINLDKEWYAAVESRVRTWSMRDDVNTATLRRFGKRWVRNLSRNISAIRDMPGIFPLAGLAANGGDGRPLPVFLAAAGPSLDRAGPLLPEIRQRCVLVAVDTSLRFLLRHGADPDFVLAVDPQFWNARHLDRCPAPRTRLIAESAVYPPVLHLPFKGVYLCSSLFPLGSFIEQRVDPKGILGAGGSVATTSWDFARTLGAEDIWIAGLDLSFPGLKTHFHGALFEERALAETERRRPTETWLFRALRDGIPFRAPASSGGQVLTDRRLSLYAAWFENRFRQFPQLRSLSLSAGGLAIAGLDRATSEALLALPPRREEIDRRIDAACSRIEADFNAAAETRRRSERYQNAVTALLAGLERIRTAAEKGARTAEGALRQTRAEQASVLAELDRITRAITRDETKDVAGFLFPPNGLAAMSSGVADPFRSYLGSAASFFRSLADSAEFNLHEMKKHPSGNSF
ncbi:MAG: DUF115 domain-containing protein [Treponema sp.]|jgi:hypothetical protein|nr:DUF115 domain-containing protein [Treponema sp.]